VTFDAVSTPGGAGLISAIADFDGFRHEAPDLESVALDHRCALLNRFEHAGEPKLESRHAASFRV